MSGIGAVTPIRARTFRCERTPTAGAATARSGRRVDLASRSANERRWRERANQHKPAMSRRSLSAEHYQHDDAREPRAGAMDLLCARARSHGASDAMTIAAAAWHGSITGTPAASSTAAR